MTGLVVGSPVVLDSSAVLAFMLGENGAARVGPTLAGGLLSSVNLCEIVTKLAERGEDAATVHADVLAFGVDVMPFSSEHALQAAQLRPLTKHLGLSLGDRACLALGLERGANVLTADKAWAGLDPGYRVEVLR